MVEFFLGAAAGALLWRWASRPRPTRDEVGLADLLPYAYPLGAHTILLKDGGLLTGYRLILSDLDSTSDSERLQKARTLHTALMMLDDRWGIEINLHRLPVRPYLSLAGAAFPTRSLHELERRRAEAFDNHFGGRAIVTECTLLFTYTPRQERVQKLFADILIKDNAKSSFADELARYVDTFERQLHELTQTLKAVWNLRRLSLSELLTECHRCLTGYSHPVVVDRPDTYLAPLVASTDLWTGNIPNVGGRYMAVAYLSGFGQTVRPDALRLLSLLPEEFRLHVRFLPLSRSAVLRRLNTYRNLWHIKFQGLAGMSGRLEKQIPGDEYMTDESARQMLEDMQQARGLLDSGQATMGLLSTTIVLSDTDYDRAVRRMDALMGRLREQGFTVDFERVHATPAFLASLPGCAGAFMRRPLYPSTVAANVFPLTAPWAGRPLAPTRLLRQGTFSRAPALMVTRTRGNTPYRLNLHVGDVGHTLIVGGTGGGKSVLVDMICHSWLRYSGSRVVVLDVDRSHYLFTLAAAGTLVDPARGLSFQPLRYIDDVQERAWAADFIRLLLDLSNYQPRSADQATIKEVLETLVASPLRTLSELASQLPTEMRQALAPYLEGGAAAFLDGQDEQFNLEGRVTTIEIGPFANAGEQTILPLLEIIFHRIEQALTPQRPTLIVVEESWMALQHAVFARRVREWLFRIRKLGGSVLLIGHRPDQFAEGSAINVLGNVPTRIFTPNPDVESMANYYKKLGLSDHVLKLLATAIPRREYLIWQPEGVRIFELALGELEKLMVGIWPGSPERETMFEQARELAERHPDDWLVRLETAQHPDTDQAETNQTEQEDDLEGSYDAGEEAKTW